MSNETARLIRQMIRAAFLDDPANYICATCGWPVGGRGDYKCLCSRAKEDADAK